MHTDGKMHDKIMKDSNAAPCATPVAQPKQEILPPMSKVISPKDITSEEARSLSQDKLIEECGQRAKLLFTSQRRLYSDASNLDVVYQEMVVRFRDQNLKGDDRGGKPTLKQAFILAGWSYQAARKFHQRYQSALKKQLITAHENPETLRLKAGDTIKDGDGEYAVKDLSDGGTQAFIAKKTQDGEEQKVVATPLYDSNGIPLFKKVTVPIPTIKVGGLYRFDKDKDGEARRCVGIGEFRVDTSVKSLAQEEREKEAKKKADAEARRVARESAKAAEAAKRAEISKAKIAAENAARDLADIANKPDVPTKKAKAKAKGKKATKAAAALNKASRRAAKAGAVSAALLPPRQSTAPLPKTAPPVKAKQAAAPEKSSVAALVTVVTARTGCTCKHNGIECEITAVNGMNADLKVLATGSPLPAVPIAELRYIGDLDAEAVL